jgi:hypothetical protein
VAVFVQRMRIFILCVATSVTLWWPLGFCCTLNFVESSHRHASFRGLGVSLLIAVCETG